MNLQWTPRLSVDLEFADEEHRILFGMLDKLHSAVMDREARTEILAQLDELAAACDAHFAHEEDFMRAMQYSALGEHHREHRACAALLRRMRNALKAGGAEIVTQSIERQFEWISRHILCSDRRYCETFRTLEKQRG